LWVIFTTAGWLTEGNPTNVVLCEGFGINYLAFTAYTVFPFLACSVAGLVALYIQFWKGHIPTRVTAPQMDPKAVLLDPIGAIVGSVALLVTLILITGTGFAGISSHSCAEIGVSAWMISLPGAVTKAIFDMIWDLFRDSQSPSSQATEGPRGAEGGIEMHHVNSEQTSRKKRSKEAEETSLTRRTRRTQSSDDQGESSISGDPRPSSPETLSLPEYLREQFNETKLQPALNAFVTKFPTLSATLKRLPYALLPFAFSQFILVEALSYTGWINVFSNWLAIVVGFSVPATVFVVGVVSVILCNVSGTNIGATILLVKVLRHPNFANREGLPSKVETAGMLALAVGSNIGAVSFTFSASLAGINPYLTN
jgi:Na+/H+ antiporter NhaD/arsenite permease-like protein